MVAMEGAAHRQATAWSEMEHLQAEREAQRERLQAKRERLQVELQLQREQMQAQTMPELAKQQAERERIQAESSLQSIQLLTEALQNRSPRSSARSSAQSSRRASRRESRQHSPEQRSSGGRYEQYPLPGIKEETGEVAAQLVSRLQELEDETQARLTPQCIGAPDTSQALHHCVVRT